MESRTEGQRLKAHLKKLNLSYGKAARTLGCEPITIYRYTAGIYGPTTKIKLKLQRKLKFKWEAK